MLRDRRERGGARPFVRACGVAICDAGRLFRGVRQCVAHRARARRDLINATGRACFVLSGVCHRARAVSLALVRAVRNESCTCFAARTQPDGQLRVAHNNANIFLLASVLRPASKVTYEASCIEPHNKEGNEYSNEAKTTH